MLPRNKESRIMRSALGVIVTVGFFLVISFVLMKLDSTHNDVLNILIGVLVTVFIQVFKYYFGAIHKDSKNDSRKYENEKK